MTPTSNDNDVVRNAVRAALVPSLLAGCIGVAHGEEPTQLQRVEVTGTVGYSSPTADNTARTATPSKDLPASIQVVPREVLRDRGVTRTDQLIEDVSGVLAESNYGGNAATFFNIRGFSESNSLRDGFRNYGYFAFRDVQNIERVEIFKGPAGALYGGVGAVGGYVNTVSKRPGPDSFGEISLTAGAYGLVRPTFDINRALSNDLSVRLNAAYEKNSTFRDNAGYDSWSIAPAIRWDNRQGTSLTLLTEFNHSRRDGFDFGVPNVANYRALSRTRYYGLGSGDYPGVSGDYGKNDTQAVTLLFDHALDDTWKVRLGAHYTYAHQLSTQTFPNSTTATGNLLDFTVFRDSDDASKQYAVQAEVSGVLALGGLKHSVLAGIDYGYLEQGGKGSTLSTLTLDLFDPAYRSGLTPGSVYGDTFAGHQGQGRDFGLYVQDLVEVTPRVKLQAGVRVDRLAGRSIESGTESGRNTQTVVSPRVGVVWQPLDSTSLFADWSRSHSPNVAHSGGSTTYDAEVAEQFEIGVKHEIIKDRLNASLVAFDIKRRKILTTDPNNPSLQVLTGAQASRGLEFDLAGTLLPGWKVIASYTFTDAVVKSDTNLPVGDRLSNVPRHHASAWSTYELRSLPGFGFGAGLYYVGEREASLPNTYKLPGYARTDATIFYKSGAWRTQLNLFNVFSRKYYTGGSAGVFNYTLDPSRPASAQLTTTYRF